MDAQRALNSLLGRLSSILIDEAQLLGSIRREVEFIRDEMESMNGLIQHLTEAQHRDHQVRAWMKQVISLARDCEGSVELYVQHLGPACPHSGKGLGLLAHLRRIFRLIHMVPARHRVAMRIRELKVRARDVGERRQRYGVTVPSVAADHDGTIMDALGGADKEEDRRRRALLDAPRRTEDTINDGIEWLIELLSGEQEPPAGEAGDGEPPPLRVLAVSGYEKLTGPIARGAYQHSSVATSFDCKAWVDVMGFQFHPGWYVHLIQLSWDILNQVAPLSAGQEDTLQSKDGGQEVEEDTQDEEGEVRQLAEKLGLHLKGKRFLIVLHDLEETLPLDWMKLALHADGPACSVMVVTTDRETCTDELCPYKIFRAETPAESYETKAKALAPSISQEYSLHSFRPRYLYLILELCKDHVFASNMFLRLLYVKPHRSNDEMVWFYRSLWECVCMNQSVAKQMVKFCYNELPSKYKSCLLYLTIFPKDYSIRRTCLVRRWIAEGLITERDMVSVMDASTLDYQAERVFDALVTRGFLHPGEITASGKTKTCTVYHPVLEFITKIATDVNFVDTDLQPDLARHFSIHNRMRLQASQSRDHVDGNGVMPLLESLATSSQWKLLKVLDLDGCKGLKKHHLKNICKIMLLKYLSLRSTDAIKLPKEIEKLQRLETLDIRQTEIRVLAPKAIVLPMLKYFLAGNKVFVSNANTRFDESLCTVRIPMCVWRMKHLETLSHVQVSESADELAGISHLLQLRKLGIVLHGRNASLNDLFSQIAKLHRCLRTLSIWIDQPVYAEALRLTDTLPSATQFLESITISGFTSGLPRVIRGLHQVAKITLIKTHMREETLRILAKLRSLSCLKLRHKSYVETELAFRAEEFQNLKFLVVEGSDIASISYESGAAPELERIVWSFTTMESLSGIENLPNLKELKLNGDCNPYQLRRDVIRHPNHPVFKNTNPRSQCQESEGANAAP